MMKGLLMKLPAALLCGASLVAVGAAKNVVPGAAHQAATASPQTINQRERRQQRRIRQGMRSGELNRREARHLERRESRLRRNEWRARRSGGVLTARERTRLQRQENERREDRRHGRR